MKSYLKYKPENKDNARNLRSSMTDAENLLWLRLRRKQICNVQFYRQKSLANYIVDFYAPAVKLVIEIDGGQHFEPEYLKRDQKRDYYLRTLGLTVLRFDNLQVLKELDAVLEVIWRRLNEF